MTPEVSYKWRKHPKIYTRIDRKCFSFNITPFIHRGIHQYRRTPKPSHNGRSRLLQCFPSVCRQRRPRRPHCVGLTYVGYILNYTFLSLYLIAWFKIIHGNITHSFPFLPVCLLPLASFPAIFLYITSEYMYLQISARILGSVWKSMVLEAGISSSDIQP